MVSLFQLKESEECYQELLKTKSKLEVDISIKANSMFIDSEGCMQCRRLFPAVRLQPTSDIFCAVLNAKVPGWDSSSNAIHSQPPAIFINKTMYFYCYCMLQYAPNTNITNLYRYLCFSWSKQRNATKSCLRLKQI